MSNSRLILKLKQLPQDTLLLLIIADFYLFGLIFHAIPFTLPYMLLFTPVVLLVFGVLGIYPLIQERRRTIWI